jgi:hypothetical protein
MDMDTNTENAVAIPSYVEDPTIPNRISSITSRENASEYDKKFLNSLRDYYMKYKRLTNKQYDSLQRSEDKYSPQRIALNDEWVKNFDEEKRKVFTLCCKYYSVTQYFNDIARKGLNDSTFIPTEKQYRAMCENNYAKRLVQNMTTIRYPVGTVIQLRSSRNSTPTVGSVIEVLDTITRFSANVGVREYKVIWMNDGMEDYVQEKNLKIYRMGAGN